MTIQKDTQQAIKIERTIIPLLSGEFLFKSFSEVMKADPVLVGSTQQRDGFGIQQQPLNFRLLKALLTTNPHHLACIKAKTNATVGLGYLSESERSARKKLIGGDISAAATLRLNMGLPGKVEEILNPFCLHNWLDVSSDITEDYWVVGSGYLEVTRTDQGKIGGLYHIPAETIYINLIDEVNYYYESRSNTGTTAKFAPFGSIKEIRDILKLPESEKLSEIVAIRQPSSLSRRYGYPDYIPSVPAMELSRCISQMNYDYFNNRGVPEFILFFLGGQVDPNLRKDIETKLQSTIGLGNQHKSMLINIENTGITVQLEKLMAENQEGLNFKEMQEPLAMAVVTAHRVPPLLAGVLIPGKIGGVNELPNALVAFQNFVVSSAQRIHMHALGTTIGPELGLELEDFEPRKITDAYDLSTMDTVARMKEPVTSARSSGRNPANGLKD